MAAAKSSLATARVPRPWRHRSPGQRLFFRQIIKLRIRRTGIIAAVLLLLDTDDIGGALVAGEQALAVFALEEFSQSFDPADDEEKIVLAFEREHRVDEIVARALVAKLDFEAVGEKRH